VGGGGGGVEGKNAMNKFAIPWDRLVVCEEWNYPQKGRIEVQGFGRRKSMLSQSKKLQKKHHPTSFSAISRRGRRVGTANRTKHSFEKIFFQ